MSTDNQKQLVEGTATLAEKLQAMAEKARELAEQTPEILANAAATHGDGAPFIVTAFTVFILACFVGYYVVWKVTPALHSPLMGITNAISSVIIVGALIAAGPMDWGFSKVMGLLAVILASINIFGGFIVTRRMLHMFKKKG